MPRDRMTRLDLDTDHFSHRKVRRLQRDEPKRWPIYHTAWLVLLCDSWQSMTRLSLDETWLPTVPCRIEDATQALIAAGLVDEEGRIPVESWSDWAEPAIERIIAASDAGRRGNAIRWGNGRYPSQEASRDPITTPSQPESPTNQPTNQASQPSQPSAREAVTDTLTNWDLSDPVDVWAYHFGKEPTDRQRDTFLASWIDTEGREGTVALLHDAAVAKMQGDREARDHVAWIDRRVKERKIARTESAQADLRQRRSLTLVEDAAVEERYRDAVRLWAERGKEPTDFTFSREDPDSVRAYIEKHGRSATG